MRAIVVTLFACAAFVALNWIPLPGLRAAAIDVSKVSVGMVGLNPIMSGFIVAELVAALVPGFRPLRHTIAGRIRLRQTSFILAFAFTAMQILGVVRYAQTAHLLDEGSLFHRPSSGSSPSSRTRHPAGAACGHV